MGQRPTNSWRKVHGGVALAKHCPPKLARGSTSTRAAKPTPEQEVAPAAKPAAKPTPEQEVAPATQGEPAKQEVAPADQEAHGQPPKEEETG